MNKKILPSPFKAATDISDTPTQPMPLGKQMLQKVPEVTVFFWVIKLLTTAVGESTSDYLVNVAGASNVIALAGIGLAALLVLGVALVLQFTARRYIAWIYWLTAIMVAIVGTMGADAVHIVLGVPYLISTIFFAVVLAIVFIAWYVCEKTLSIHSISTRRRELFYWAAIMATFALGTATGDMTASTLSLGYFLSAVLFLVIIAIPAIGFFGFKLNAIFAFWFAYIITRPLGASFADWFGKPRTYTGLGFGDGTVSSILYLLIIILVGYLTVTHKDVKNS